MERDIQIGHAPWQLASTLTLPAGKGPFPALVLVHGSGPQDRDERIGACTPFRDLAWGLAQKGVAVLRYEKRTYAHHQACAALDKLTVQEETVSDAASALASLRSVPEPEVDSHRIFVLGHSLGGYLLPRIAQAAPEGAGFIALAGSARPMEDLVLEQLRRQNAPGETIAACEAEVAKIKALDAQRPTVGFLLFAPASYWLDLKGYEPAQEAKRVHKPMMLLQGEADCQVTLEDFRIWQQALSTRKDVEFHRFPGLNSLFMRVTGKLRALNTASRGSTWPRTLSTISPNGC
ncbi:MAG TPA: alpha/beta fold hydrolase [Holophaga sp.]|nr:alpha/beta fold hydrolase [Holophaga sp.]